MNGMGYEVISFNTSEAVVDYVCQMAHAFGLSKAGYVRKIVLEDMERKKDVIPKINQIKNLQAEIREMEVERKKMEALITEMMEKTKELKRLQEEVLSA